CRSPNSVANSASGYDGDPDALAALGWRCQPPTRCIRTPSLHQDASTRGEAMAREFRLGCDLRSFTSKEIRMAEGIDPSHQHIHEEWHRAASTRDQAALIALYADDAILETPLAPQILVGKPDGIL